MFTVNGNPILASELDILYELRAQLALNGIERFSTIRTGAGYIQFNCPIHNDGRERRPSCSISTRDKPNFPIGAIHCFTCGYSVYLDEMISHCFGYDDNGRFGREWLTKNFMTVSVENRKDLQLDMSRDTQVKKLEYVSDEELDSYRFYHPYMYERKLTDAVIEEYDIGYDGNFKLVGSNGKIQTYRCITFPVRNAEGKTLFIARRSIDTKFFHYPSGVIKPLYGLYELPKDIDEVVVCESVFNTLTCRVYGDYSVSLLGLGTEFQYEQLKKLPCRKLKLALDPDKAGQNAADRLSKALKGYKIITRLRIPAGKDVNDLSEDEYRNLEELY